MTKKELINRYFASVGRTLTQGESAEPLLPFLLGDAILTIFTRDIAPLDLRHEEKRLRKDWSAHYTIFNRPFFSAIGIDNYDQITDLMDDFEAYIDINIMTLRSEIMLLLQDVPFERRQVIVSAILCHVLAQAAQCAWGNCYRVGKVVGYNANGRQMIVHRPEKNPHLQAINKDAFQLTNRWHAAINKALIDPNKTKGIPAAIAALCRKIYSWVETTDKTENAM